MMFIVSKSATTSNVICTLVRDHLDEELVQYYGIRIRNSQNNQYTDLPLVDVSVSYANYQLFVFSGSSMPIGQHEYSLHPSTGSTTNDINHSITLQTGIINIIG